MVETRQVTCDHCGRQTMVTCSCSGEKHCPKCAKVPDKKAHVWLVVR